MKTKIVLWGTNENDEKILIGIELLEAENKVKIYTFPESAAKEDFYNLMLNDWRINNPVVFPEDHQVIERPLSITESLLPDEIKVTRTDVINRAKAEWHFVVLSAKLYQSYKIEVEGFKERISNLDAFDKNIWEELKAFWKKVQDQVYEKSLFRSHAKTLQNETNQLFDKLKEFRKKLDQEFHKASKERAKTFHERLSKVEQKLSEGLGLQPLWNEMKNIQSSFRSENLAKGDRNELWNKIDALFKSIKEKKYGSKQGSGSKNSALERIQNRYKGLMAAIKKMENSIKWDKKDMNFQGDRVEETFGQLEQEIRKAKMLMIEERINSKEAKLAEMHETRIMLEEKLEKEKEKAAKMEEARKIKEAEQEAKERIKKEIEIKNKDVEKEIGAETLAAAAAAVSDTESSESQKVETSEQKEKVEPEEAEPEVKENTDSSEVAAEELVQSIRGAAEDVIDTVKATAQVIGKKISEGIDAALSDSEEE